ncbi:MAG: 2-amino-4-hydroxy-6-hydroxymethyldihydropteridine diphosphokinase [Gemmatimonadota bacterium]
MGTVAFVALGSNLGDRHAYLAQAREGLGRLPGTAVVGASQIEETVPLGNRDQPPYLNQMVAVETSLTPRELLEACLAIEREAGRARSTRWASRTLDLDIVRYGDLTVHEPDLVIPHPGLADRPFWQRELAELLPHATVRQDP